MESITTTYQNTLSVIEKYIQSPDSCAQTFDHIASELFAYQSKTNPSYGKFCQQLGISSIERWQDMPAVTTDVFKLSSPPSCLQAEQIAATFMTSGTTGESRGQHHFRSTALYELSIMQAWKDLGIPTPNNLHILTPTPSAAPHSSLSHMMGTLRQTFAPSAPYLIEEDTIKLAPLLSAIEQGQPLALIGTALAFLNLFEILESPLTLPKGSWAMETGGYKGSGRTLTKEQLYTQFQQSLGLDEQDIWNEYSMTELSSQCYTQGLAMPHRSPHWMKVRVLDPETDEDVKVGGMGYLVLYDLANIDSIAAIRTQDLAIYHDEHHFSLIGRDPSALPRGCSRSIDQALNN